MRKLIFTLILLLAGYIGYMYFFGKGEDKSNARVIVSETREVVKAVGDFLKIQKEKYDDGEFDKLIDKVGDAIAKLKSAPSGDEGEVKKTLEELEREIRQIDPGKLNKENKEKLEKVFKDLEEAKPQ